MVEELPGFIPQVLNAAITFRCFLVRLTPSRITTPLLVLDGENDSALTGADVRSTASAYGAHQVLFENMGHNMMLEPGWQTVAERIRAWLGEQGL
jgi:pimeloyl-ACP methyl ester carboxylesterase